MFLRLALFLLLLASPVHADSCQAYFRAGLATYAQADAQLVEVEDRLYHGLGWVSRSAVLNRLENLSAMTSACEEVATLQASLARAGNGLTAARDSFTLAQGVCSGENQARVQRNLVTVAEVARALADQVTYLGSLADRCGGA